MEKMIEQVIESDKQMKSIKESLGKICIDTIKMKTLLKW